MFGKWDIFDVVKAFFRFLVVVAIGAVFAALLWRMVTSRVPSELKEISRNEILDAAYAERKSDLRIVTQEQNSITRGEKNYGYFTACQMLWIPEAEQLQLLIRYNDSTVKATVRDYDLAAAPDPELDWYDVTLVVATDLTPDNEEDNITELIDPEAVLLARLHPTEVSMRVHKGLHSYRRLVFNGVKEENLLAIYADFFYVGDKAYETENFDIYTDEAYGTLCLYAYTEPLETVEHKAVGLK